MFHRVVSQKCARVPEFLSLVLVCYDTLSFESVFPWKCSCLAHPANAQWPYPKQIETLLIRCHMLNQNNSLKPDLFFHYNAHYGGILTQVVIHKTNYYT